MRRCLLLFTQTCFTWAGGLLICAFTACAAVDPNLFDGRMTLPPPTESPEASGSQGATRGTAQSADEGVGQTSPDSRDFSEIASVTAGEAVGGVSSKAYAPSESSSSHRDLVNTGQVGVGESVAHESSKSGATGSSAGDASGTSIDSAAEAMTATGGSGGGTPTERSFEDFGFGATDEGSSTVKVYESKGATVPPSPSSSSDPVLSNTNTPNLGSGASTPEVEAGSGDFGSNLPAGL